MDIYAEMAALNDEWRNRKSPSKKAAPPAQPSGMYPPGLVDFVNWLNKPAAPQPAVRIPQGPPSPDMTFSTHPGISAAAPAWMSAVDAPAPPRVREDFGPPVLRGETPVSAPSAPVVAPSPRRNVSFQPTQAPPMVVPQTTVQAVPDAAMQSTAPPVTSPYVRVNTPTGAFHFPAGMPQDEMGAALDAFHAQQPAFAPGLGGALQQAFFGGGAPAVPTNILPATKAIPGLSTENGNTLRSTLQRNNEYKAAQAMQERVSREREIEAEKNRQKAFQLEKMRHDNAVNEYALKMKRDLELQKSKNAAGRPVVDHAGNIHWVSADPETGEPTSKLLEKGVVAPAKPHYFDPSSGVGVVDTETGTPKILVGPTARPPAQMSEAELQRIIASQNVNKKAWEDHYSKFLLNGQPLNAQQLSDIAEYKSDPYLPPNPAVEELLAQLTPSSSHLITDESGQRVEDKPGVKPYQKPQRDPSGMTAKDAISQAHQMVVTGDAPDMDTAMQMVKRGHDAYQRYFTGGDLPPAATQPAAPATPAKNQFTGKDGKTYIDNGDGTATLVE